MEEKSLLLQLTGEVPLFKIIDFLVENKGNDFSKEEIVNGVDIGRATLFNYWDHIEKFEIVKVTKTLGKTKYYALNTKNTIVKRLLDLEMALIQSSLETTQKKEATEQETTVSMEQSA